MGQEQVLGTGAAAPVRRSAPWWKWALSVGLAAGLIALLAFGFTRSPKDIPSPLVRQPAPAFTLALLDGGHLTLGGLRGKVVVLNFWASWCYPACWNEASRLQAAWERFRERGVVLVGIVYQDREQGAREFIRKHGKTYPNGMDPRSRIAIDYGVYGVPETFFIDREGRIAHKHVGEIGMEVLVARIEELLLASGGTPARTSPGAPGARASFPASAASSTTDAGAGSGFLFPVVARVDDIEPEGRGENLTRSLPDPRMRAIARRLGW